MDIMKGILTRMHRGLVKLGLPEQKVVVAAGPQEVERAPSLEEQRQARAERQAKYRASLQNAIMQLSSMPAAGSVPPPAFTLEPYIPPKGVIPASATPTMGMDSHWKNMAFDDASAMLTVSGITSNVIAGLGFPGFPFLTELTQLTEYRDMSERTASEMTRKWIKLKSTGDEDDSSDIEIIESEMKRHNIRDLFREAAVMEGFMGRSQIFVNLGDTEGIELTTPMLLNKFKITPGCLRGFKLVEPITTYPAAYNASNPLSDDYYKPSSWFVYGQKVHASRLLTFISRPVPDLLKPVYNFSGMSMSQLAMPYVDYWYGTRDSVGKLLRNYSTTVFKTDLDVLLSPQGQEIVDRMTLFVKMRDNQGVFIANKDKEDMAQFNVPLSGLDKLQAQAQEHMAAVAKTPLVILLGITPTGLNATAEGDIRIYYDYVAEQQEKLFRKNLEVVLKVIMLDKLGRINENITFDFVSLYEMSEKEKSEIRKSNAESASLLIPQGVLSPLEVRTQMANDPESGYDNLDLSVVPKVPGEEDDTDEQDNEDEPQPGLQLAGASAVDVMNKAAENAPAPEEPAAAADGGFRGNQHLGGFSDSDNPIAVAMRLTQAATKSSQEAQRLGTRRAHAAAHAAHRRALEAHKRALSSAEGQRHPEVHTSYMDAHRTAKAIHNFAK